MTKTGTAIDAGIWINVECNIGIVSACVPLLRPFFITDYPSSPASHLARFFRSFSSYHASRGSQEDNLKEKGANFFNDPGMIIAKPRNTYRPPANSDASESTLDIRPEPIAKDEKYLTWGLSAAFSSVGLEGSKYEAIKEGDIEKLAWRSTFETTRDGADTGNDLEGNRSWSSRKSILFVRNFYAFVKKRTCFSSFREC